MIEVKLSQGAKPGHGGVLPGSKVTAEIAATRGVRPGEDCLSPARHSEFGTPVELLQFVERLRKLSGGKPTGFKLCIGHPWEWFAICKAMFETGLTPDFIVVDGSEGGTGAAPLEFADHVGTPLQEGLLLVHNTLVGLNLRHRIKIGCSGKIISAFDIARALALGADWCNSARGFMFALGCLQAQTCHTGKCPTGVATQDPLRQRALAVPDKIERVYRFHHHTLARCASSRRRQGSSIRTSSVRRTSCGACRTTTCASCRTCCCRSRRVRCSRRSRGERNGRTACSRSIGRARLAQLCAAQSRRGVSRNRCRASRTRIRSLACARALGSRRSSDRSKVTVRDAALVEQTVQRSHGGGAVPLAAERGGRVDDADARGVARLAQEADHAARLVVYPEVQQLGAEQLHAHAAVERCDAAVDRRRGTPALRERGVARPMPAAAFRQYRYRSRRLRVQMTATGRWC